MNIPAANRTTDMTTRVCLSALLASAFSATASTVALNPTPVNLGDLHHDSVYVWGVQLSLPTGQVITDATFTFQNLYETLIPDDILHIELLDWAPVSGGKNVTAWPDTDPARNNWFNDANPAFAAVFASVSHQTLTQYEHDGLGPDTAVDYSYSLTPDQLAVLNAYLANDGIFGLGFDPDCLYVTSGLTLTLSTSTTSVPDTGATGILLALGFCALAGFRPRIKS